MGMDYVAEEGKAFYLADGRCIRSLAELDQMLPTLPLHVFQAHVADGKNDFATWVNDVFHDASLSQAMMEATHPREMQAVLHVHSMEKELEQSSSAEWHKADPLFYTLPKLPSLQEMPVFFEENLQPVDTEVQREVQVSMDEVPADFSSPELFQSTAQFQSEETINQPDIPDSFLSDLSRVASSSQETLPLSLPLHDHLSEGSTPLSKDAGSTQAADRMQELILVQEHAEEISGKLMSLEGENQVLSDRLQQLDDDHADLHSSHQALLQENTHREKHNSLLNEKILAHEYKHGLLMKKTQALLKKHDMQEKRYLLTKTELSALESQHSQLMEEAHQHKRRAKELEHSTLPLQKKYDALQVENKSLRQELQESIKVIENLELDFKRVRELFLNTRKMVDSSFIQTDYEAFLRLIHKGYSLADEGHLDLARDVYSQVMAKYKGMSPKMKRILYPSCVALHTLLS